MRKYTTERGVAIKIIPIPLLLDQIRESHSRPEAPTYTEKLASGDVEVAIDAQAMAAAKEHNPEWYKEHQEAWEEYLAAAAISEAALNDRLMNAVALKGVDVEMPEDDGWVAEQEFLGMEVPDGALERRVHYFRTEVLGGPKDIIRVMALAAGSDVDEEVLARAVDSFRDYLQGNLAEGLTDQAGALEDEPEDGAVAGGGQIRPSTLNLLGVRPS
jgi:hypothetical protein